MPLNNQRKLKFQKKKSTEEKLKFRYGPINKIGSAINKLRNSGIKTRANGIKTLKLSSKVSEFVIQEIPLK